MTTLRVGSEDHDVGDRGCAACAMPYPRECECGGLVHGNIDWERGQELMLPMEQEALDTKCDRCGRSDRIVQQRWEPTAEDQRKAEELAEKLTGKKWDFGTPPEEPEPSK